MLPLIVAMIGHIAAFFRTFGEWISRISRNSGNVDNTEVFDIDPKAQSWYDPAQPDWRPLGWEDGMGWIGEDVSKPAPPGGDLPAAADAEVTEELTRRFGSQPEPTKPVRLYPGNTKRLITPED